MILESAQLLCTAHRILDGNHYLDKTANGRRISRWELNDQREQTLYKASHVNHPSAVWVRGNMDHYRWLYDLMYSLIVEYKHRYDGKYHKCESMMMPLLDSPRNIPIVDWQDPPQAMPEDSKVLGDSVAAYRNYYRIHKARFATWKNREVPSWYK